MRFSRAFCILRVALKGSLMVLAACSTTGNRFDTTDLRFLVPGETTLAEAKQLLQGEPVNIYRQADGSATARWAHTATLATDAVYFNQELWLAFDSYGRFERIVKSNNVPHANLYQDGRRVDLPVPHGAAAPAVSSQQTVVPVFTPTAPAANPLPTNPAATINTPAAAAQAPAVTPLHRTAVSYPLGQQR